jgi:excisionase family DNA binding protein
MKPKPSELLTPQDAAGQLMVSAEQVRCLIRSGQLAAINVGTGSKRPLYRITTDALADFMSRRFQPAPAIRPKRFKRLTPIQDHFPDLR